jgi:hypothetical protein
MRGFFVFISDRYGNRSRARPQPVTAVKGQCPNRKIATKKAFSLLKRLLLVTDTGIEPVLPP